MWALRMMFYLYILHLGYERDYGTFLFHGREYNELPIELHDSVWAT